MGNTSFLKLIGKQVKVKYLDEEKTYIVKGTLEEANDSFIVVNDIVIGLGKNFIICIPQDESNG